MQLTTLCIVVFICHVTMTSARATREDDSDEISNYGIRSGSEEQDNFLPQEKRDFEDDVELNQQEEHSPFGVGHSLQKRSNDLPKSDSETADPVDDDCNRGSPGRDGRDGQDGRDGAVGDAGPKGEPGLPGTNGSVGPEGPAGSSGAPGSPGPQGPHGAAGPPGVPGQPAPNPGTGSSTYIRWGRTVCPSTASLVYAGLAAGGHYTHTGGISTHLCLPETPEYDSYQPGTQSYSTLYSAEYQTHNFSPFHSLRDHDAPCAVCKVGNRGAIRMIPAIMTCPQGWTKEYHGYLMGEHYSHKRGAEPICVDRNPEVVPGTTSNQNGALLYAIEVRCDGDGNLPCSPYSEEKELTCVVCSF